jgi:hypothetical protein
MKGFKVIKSGFFDTIQDLGIWLSTIWNAG